MRRNWVRILNYGALIMMLIGVADWVAASWILWAAYGRIVSALSAPSEHLSRGHTTISVEEIPKEPGKSHNVGRIQAWGRGRGFVVQVEHRGNTFDIEHAEQTRVWAAKPRILYESEHTKFQQMQRALKEVVESLPRPHFLQRVAIAIWFHPFLTGFTWDEATLQWKIWFSGGGACIGVSDWVCTAWYTESRGNKKWQLAFRHHPNETADFRRIIPTDARPVSIPAEDLDRSLATVLRVFALQWQPVPKEPDRIAREGKGWLKVKDGRRVLHLSGTSREIGFQHGKLLAPNIKRLAERVLYGVGFAYSLEKGQWFLREAEKLVERQRLHIPPEYFEEMQGIADGAGVPVAIVQAANIFPEFFHCSGAALFGKATKGGALLHARVLDYMTEVGLQDDAVVMAVERTGARRFVNVSYAGFIGSVTGMNEKQVAIGEMGGGGQGQWDGTPMSFLVRGALENCDTLEQVLDYMRTRKRTCEYFYVISDGKSKSARGVAATPDKFETVAPGEYHPLLPESVEDAVLLSTGNRYKELVKRVREQYGRIGPLEFMKIIARPVAMKSNLHNVIFEPQRLHLWVAHASRHAPACDQPYVAYTWDDLFRPAP